MTTIRVLMVADGKRFNFGPAQADVDNRDYFGVTWLTSALKADPTIHLDTAHRRGAAYAGKNPDTSKGLTYPGDFKFTDIDLNQYDVLWLLGDEGLNNTSANAPTDSEIGGLEKIAIANFMGGGGGVFAVGDHDGIGALLCGRLPRVRVMRKWFEWDEIETDTASGQVFMPNWSVGAYVGAPIDIKRTDRNDTLLPDADGKGKFYFFDQSDEIPQALVTKTGTPLASGPVHPIMGDLISGIIDRFPDHMHEGEATDLTTISKAGPGTPFNPNDGMGNPRPLAVGSAMDGFADFIEFPKLAGTQPLPQVIAWGKDSGHETILNASTFVASNAKITGKVAIYDGRAAGVGRIVTGATFHHYIDKNIIGDPQTEGMGGPPTKSNLGLKSAVKDGMAQYFRNVAQWLARPVRSLTFLVDKSTYGLDEVNAHPMGAFDKAFFVVVDGLKPSDFPGGPIDELIDPDTVTPAQLAKLANWAPSISTPPAGISFTPIGVASDDPSLLPRVQRFTFAYRLTISDPVSLFSFVGSADLLNLIAVLSVVPDPGIGWAEIELIKDADPYFSNYANGNTVGWLSSDLRVFKVVQGEAPFGKTLGGTPSDARAFIVDAVAKMTPATFDALPTDEKTSALSLFGTTPGPAPKAIFNFALARVRLNGVSLPADPVRVFFRVFQSPTTEALTYQLDGFGDPKLGYRQFNAIGPDKRKIPLLGIDGSGTEYTSIPCFAEKRVTNSGTGTNLTTQTDIKNTRQMIPTGTEEQFFFGAWLDTNQSSPDLFPLTPSGQAHIDGPFTGKKPMTALLMGVHQCLGAEIVFDGAPIPDGSTPYNCDKLAQRNIAYTTVANPGTPGSRTAIHSFDIRPSPFGLDATHRPDELMIDWGNVPAGTTASIYLPAAKAGDVVALADKLYATHGIVALDTHTLLVPVGGITYVPVLKGGQNFAGLFSLDLPAGIVKGQRFDVSVRQITMDGPQIEHLAPSAHKKRKVRTNTFTPPKTARGLVTAPNWQKVYGAFQVAIPVSTKADMLVPEARTLSVLRWIGGALTANSRWQPVFDRYVGTIEARVRGLGGDPDTIPATPDGQWPELGSLAAGGGLATLAPAGGTGDIGTGVFHPHLGHGITGKIDALIFDHFGDFQGFVLETPLGAKHRYDSREPRVRDLASRACDERITTTIYAAPEHPHRPLEIVLRGVGMG